MSQLSRKFEKPFLIFLVLGALLTFALVDLPPYIKGINAMGWPSTDGKIDSIDMQYFTVGRDPAWTPKVQYHYSVDKISYSSDTLAFQAPIGLPGYESGQYGEKYKKGKEIDVFYDPKNPKDAYLENNPSLTVGIAHLLAYLIFVFIIYLSVYPKIADEKNTKEEPNKQINSPEPQT